MLAHGIVGMGTCALIRVAKVGREVSRLAKEESRVITETNECRWKHGKDCRCMVVWQL